MPEDEVVEAWRGSVVHAAERMGLLPAAMLGSFAEFMGRAEVARLHSGTLLSAEGLVPSRREPRHPFCGFTDWARGNGVSLLTREAVQEAYEQYRRQVWETEDAIRGVAPVVIVEHHLTDPDAWFLPNVGRLAGETVLRWENPSAVRPWRWPDEQADNVTEELLELVKRGDEAGFRALAGCVMPADEVDECWHGAQARLGLPP